jgi:hyperosmotically inducible protein
MSLRLMQKMLPIVILIPLVVMMYTRNQYANLKTAVNKAIATNTVLSTVSISVDKGVVTLSGEVKDDATKAAADAAARTVYGVKSVTNNLTINPSLSFVLASSNNQPDNDFTKVLKNHPSVTATIHNGVITLTGEIGKAAYQHLMISLNALNPKKVENKLTIKS